MLRRINLWRESTLWGFCLFTLIIQLRMVASLCSEGISNKERF